MAPSDEIKSEKILLKDIFEKLFHIPEYQRPYVWGDDQIQDLLDDLTFAVTNKPDSEYFMGSIVFQSKPADEAAGRLFEENDLLDGQQRLATLLLLLAVIRDTTNNEEIRTTCQSCIFQKARPFLQKPERVRLVFDVLDSVNEFVERFIKTDGRTKETEAIATFTQKNKDISVVHMANGLSIIRKFFTGKDAQWLGPFLYFLLNKVLLIYVSTEHLEDAFRLFTILNNRGMPLRPGDILKSINLGAMDNSVDKMKYARMWAEAEGELDEDFDRFLSYIRTILVKEKARQGLLEEFKDQIYDPKEKDKKTGTTKPVLLQKGKPTFKLIERYFGNYKQLLSGSNYDTCKSFAFDNLVSVMNKGLPATDWIPPLMRYYDKFSSNNLLDFLNCLNRKFAGDWLSQKTPTDRIEAMNNVIKIIDDSSDAASVLNSGAFAFDSEGFLRTVKGDVYSKRFDRYILLMLDFMYQNQDQKMHLETLSVEHILPQTPDGRSQWVKNFTNEQRKEWMDKLGNLVLITRRKNTSQGNLDYEQKKKKYFEKNIDSCPNSLRVLNKYAAWTPTELAENQLTVLTKLEQYFS